MFANIQKLVIVAMLGSFLRPALLAGWANVIHFLRP
jgi:hypothetical protein